MLFFFWYKIFFEKYFGIFECLVRAKIMINENYFQFDHKSIFNFLKMIYAFKNRKLFSEFKLFIFSRMFVKICHH
jgi:hypothetical protein